MHGVRLGLLYPAGTHAGAVEAFPYGLVGIHYYAFGVGYVGAEEYAGHTLAGAVLDTVAGVYDEGALVLEALQQGYGASFAAHVDDYAFLCGSCYELLLAVDVYLAAAFAQLLGHDVEYRRVVSYMVGGVGARAHYPRYFGFGHYAEVIMIVLKLQKYTKKLYIR